MSRWASYDDARDVLEDDDDCCPDCLGEGCCHDCGEDTCCCAYPDEDDMRVFGKPLAEIERDLQAYGYTAPQPPSPTPSPADQEGA